MSSEAMSPASSLIPELVARQAALTPEAVAVVSGAQLLDYAGLDRRADRLAGRLRASGVGPETPVGVRMARSTDLVVALLAVWRAGAAYLPLDPEAPRARTADLIAATGTRLVLCDAEGADEVSASGAEPLVPADPASPADLAGPGALPEDPSGEGPGTDPGAAAYILHTSGSTGTPKGVVVSHESIANRVNWAVRQHGLGAADRVLQKTALVFDAHVWEVFAPLVSGGTLVLAPAGVERDPAAMVRAVGEYRVTVLQVVPSVLRMLVQEDGWQDCSALRLVFSAGEPLHAELVQRLRRLAPVDVWNTYGPTECSIDVTAHRFDPAQEQGPVPIGRPLDRMRVLVVDANGSPVGVGIPGELLAGGVGVARGYHGRPGQTAERFVPDPFAKDGTRLYRTGDRVRWRADGVLEYLGRIDDQVKVNGVRIEPGEVEAVLVAHPEVRGAVVHPYQLPDGSKRLAAYLLLREGSNPAGLDLRLRAQLLERLPMTHLPSAYVPLAEFPLGPTGKVDRRALPAPDLVAEPGEAPATDAERMVAAAWQQVLGRQSVARDDDFFSLGGTSLQLTRLATLLRAESGQKITLRALLTTPTVRGQAALIAPAHQAPEAAEGHDLRPVPRDGGLPLSSGQRRLWFMDQLHRASPEWVAGLLLKVPAGDGAELVEQALQHLVDRHEALRTHYTEVDGEPRQFVRGTVEVPFRTVGADRGELPGLLAENLGSGFALDGGPLLRALLVRLPDGTGVLAVAMHHITTDGWSSAILEREFGLVLDALRQGVEPQLPPLAVQYADYADWQQRQLTAEVLAEELGHWRRVLDGHTPLSLPTDRARPAVRDGRGSVVPLTVPAPVARSLERTGREHGATPFATLLTAFATVLARYSGQWDLPVGTPVAGRGRPELDGVVGFFLNNLVLRCELGPELPFAEAVRRVGAVCRDAFGHQDLPFDVLVDELAPDRDLSRTPLYQVAFDLHGEEFNGAVDGDLETLRSLWRITHTDLTLLLRPGADGELTGGLEYASSLFDESTAVRLAGRLETLLTAVAAEPGLPLGSVDLLPEQETADLARWGSAPGPEIVASVPELITRTAAARPDAAAIAVAGSGTATSYRELLGRAAQVARYLRPLGVHRGVPVGVLLDRGQDLHAALLGVWLAGGAYVPLDPAFPADRMAGMLADAGARVLLTQNSYGRTLDGAFTGTVVELDGLDSAAVAAESADPVDLAVDPDDLAYIIYTSGSTGRPKGVGVTHRGLANHLLWAADRLAGAGRGGSAVFSSVAFDLVVPNLWAPLLVGQQVLLLPQQLDLSELGGVLAAEGPYSFLKLTPGHLEILLTQLTREQAAGLAGVVVVAGEALDTGLARRWARLLGEGRLVNEYGPTETSVGATVHPVPLGADAGTEEAGGVVPIGTPLPGTVLRILDERLRPVGAGSVGELFVGGTGVARGYVGRPGLTADRFLPDPYGPPGTRLYRTGDVARWNAGGAVEFLGRADDQVKIRGYRVELGEIRSVLLAHPAVEDAVVVAHGSGSQLRLAAYTVAADGLADGLADGSADALAEHCARLLPPYMVPASFTELAAVPLNRNGKVDRRALPAPAVPTAADGPEGPDAPDGPVEECILAIWRDSLGIDAGVRDNFFQAGGNSILAIRLIAEIQGQFEVTLPVRAVFEGPTVAALARAVEDAVRAEIDQMSDADVLADSQLLKEQNA